eukprot:scaffold1828_cov98-Cylindrotheca_fusiformis.AAC.5
MVMMTKQTIFLVAILMLLDGEDNGMTPASAFSPTILPSSSTAMKSSSLSMVSREDYLRPRFYSAPTTKPTTTPIVITKTNDDEIEEDDNHSRMTSLDMNRVQYCADEGCCDLEEMSQLLQDLERMRDECSTVANVGPNNPIPHECSVEQHATREMYMDELGYQMERFMHRKLQQQEQQQEQLESNKEDLDAEDEEIRMSDQVMNEDEEEDVLKQHLQRMRDIASYEEH